MAAKILFTVKIPIIFYQNCILEVLAISQARGVFKRPLNIYDGVVLQK